MKHPPSPISIYEGYHFTGGNYLAVDGHVKWFKGETVSGGRTAAAITSGENMGVGVNPRVAQGTNGTTGSAAIQRPMTMSWR